MPKTWTDLNAENATLRAKLEAAEEDTARLVKAAGEALFQLKIAVERGVVSRNNEETWMHRDTMTLTRERLRAAIDRAGKGGE